MFVADLLKAHVNADIAVGDNFNAAFFKLGHTLHHDVFFELKSGDSIGQKPARAIIAIIDCHLHTGPPQHIGRCQTARACANNANRFPTHSGRLDRLHPAFSPGRIGDMFLHRTNGHSFMARLLNHAVAFTQAILWTYTATNLRECICRLAHLIGFPQPPLSRES